MTETRPAAASRSPWDAPAADAARAASAAVLGGLADEGRHEAFEPERAALVIEWIGDGLRLGITIPGPLARWLEQLTVRELDRSLDVVIAELDAIPIFTAPDGEYDDHLVEHAAKGRDRSESFKVGVVRACIAKRIAPVSIPGFERLCDALDSTTSSFTVLGRETTIAGLGNRRWMLADGDWTAALRSGEVVAADSLPCTQMPTAVPRSIQPPPAAILAYAARGEMVRWIEGVAMADRSFAELLAATIRDLREEQIQGLTARRWLQRWEQRDAEPIAYALRPARVLRSSSQNTLFDAEPVEIELGRLYPVAAEGRLLGHSDEVELRVTAAAGTVLRVRLGDQTTDSPDSDGVWVVRVPNEAGKPVLPFAVVEAGGARCEVLLRIDDLE